MVRLSNDLIARLQHLAAPSHIVVTQPMGLNLPFCHHETCRTRLNAGVASPLHSSSIMLKLLGSYALAKLLGFGLFGAIVIYALLSLLT
jgi:hypothetical protein